MRWELCWLLSLARLPISHLWSFRGCASGHRSPRRTNSRFRGAEAGEPCRREIRGRKRRTSARNLIRASPSRRKFSHLFITGRTSEKKAPTALFDGRDSPELSGFRALYSRWRPGPIGPIGRPLRNFLKKSEKNAWQFRRCVLALSLTNQSGAFSETGSWISAAFLILNAISRVLGVHCSLATPTPALGTIRLQYRCACARISARLFIGRG